MEAPAERLPAILFRLGFLSRLAVALAVLGAGPLQSLDIALEDYPLGSCQSESGGVLEHLAGLLEDRGHAVWLVDGSALDSTGEISRFDVVVFGAGPFECDWDWSTFDGQLAGYLRLGGGLVVTGWGAHYLVENPKEESYPGLEAALPVEPGIGFTEGRPMTVLPGHPITAGVSGFANPTYNNYGFSFPVEATLLLEDDGIDSAAAWDVGGGRAVYLGPIYLAWWSYYDNEELLDGSVPDATLLLLQAIEWAGGKRIFLDGFESGQTAEWSSTMPPPSP